MSEPYESYALTDVEIYRYIEFGRMGFSVHEARALARSVADLHVVKDMLKAGCSLALALDISL